MMFAISLLGLTAAIGVKQRGDDGVLVESRDPKQLSTGMREHGAGVDNGEAEATTWSLVEQTAATLPPDDVAPMAGSQTVANPYNFDREANMKAAMEWHTFTIEKTKNFCRRVANHTNNQVADCAGLNQATCDDSYSKSFVTGTATHNLENNNGEGRLTPCVFENAACGNGPKQNCSWSLYMLDVITQQKYDEGHCYAELLEAKRSVDGLLSGVNKTHAEIMYWNRIIEAENITIRDALANQGDLWDEYMTCQTECPNGSDPNGTIHRKALMELREMAAISNPDVRSAVDFTRDTLSVQPDYTPSFLEEGTVINMDEEACTRFASLVQRSETLKSVVTQGVDCHQQRVDLQTTFTKAYNDIIKLTNIKGQGALERAAWCYSNCTYGYKKAVEGVGGIDDQIQAAAQKIHEAQRAIARLEPHLHDEEHSIRVMEHYIAKLKSRCVLEDDLLGNLKTVRTLIMDLEACPGRNDFVLQIPSPESPDTPSTYTTPSPTPWQQRP